MLCHIAISTLVHKRSLVDSRQGLQLIAEEVQRAIDQNSGSLPWATRSSKPQATAHLLAGYSTLRLLAYARPFDQGQELCVCA